MTNVNTIKDIKERIKTGEIFKEFYLHVEFFDKDISDKLVDKMLKIQDELLTLIDDSAR